MELTNLNNMFNRKLKQRIKSLEEYLGVVFSPKDGKYDDAEHNKKDWGLMRNLEDMIEEWQEKTKIKKIK